MIGFQRAQIRGRYDINGSLAKDIIAGLFLPACTLINNDREVRAREGVMDLRNKEQYKNWRGEDFEDRQPIAQPSMRYVPPNHTSDLAVEMSERTAIIEMVDDESCPSRRGKKLEKPRSIPAAVELQKRPKSEKRKGTAAETSGCGKGKPGNKNIKTQPVTEKPPSRQLPSPRSTKATPENQQPSSEQRHELIGNGINHKLSACSDSTAERVPNDGTQKATQEHPLIDCSLIDTSKTTFKAKSITPLEAHGLTDCTIIQRENQNDGHSQHTLTDCDTIVAEPGSTIQKHGLSECDSIDTTSEAQELSYVHDFSDCPVDKAVLEYYEKEEKKAHQHILADCTQASSGGNSELNIHLLPHALADCSGDNGEPNAVGSRTQKRASKNISDMERNEKGSTTNEHLLVSCPTPIMPHEEQRLKKHRLASCSHTILSDEESELTKEHRLESCAAPSPKDFDNQLATSKKRKGKGADSSARGVVNPSMDQERSDPDGMHGKHGHVRTKSQQKPISEAAENKGARAARDNAQRALTQVLTSQARTKDNSQKGNHKSGRKVERQKIRNEDALRAHSPEPKTVDTQQENTGSGDEQKTQSSGVSGIWNKITGHT